MKRILLAFAGVLAFAMAAHAQQQGGGGGGGTSTGCTVSGGAGIVSNNGSSGCSTDTNAQVSAGALALGASGTAGSIVVGNTTSGTITIQPVTGALGAVTLSLPDATDTLVGRATTDTLTNKTLTSPTVNGGALSGTFSGNFTLSGVPVLSGLSTGSQTYCLGLDSGNHIVLTSGACGSGGGGITIGTTAITGGAANGLLYDNGGTVGNLATADSGILVTNGSGVPSIATALPNGITATTQSAGDNSTKVATTAYVQTAVTPPLTVGSSTGNSLSAPFGFFVCTATCTVTPPVPAAGYEFCVWNDDDVSTVITLGALGSSAFYENSARTAYGTAGTGTLTSGGAVGDKVCIVGRDSTHYFTISYVGTWTAS